MRNTVGKLMIAAAALLAAHVAVGCGDSDSETVGPGAGGSGGTGGSGGDGPGPGGSGGSGGGGDSFGGPPGTACLATEDQLCQEHRGTLEAFFDAADESCVEDGGEVVSACSKDGLVGTCTHAAGGVETTVYFYGDHDPSELKSACEMQGVWKDA